ncbi:MAG: PSP1 domain-containing protein [Candidatus Aminicenantaceae bacterium]
MPENTVCVYSERLERIMRASPGDIEVKPGDLCILESNLGGELVQVKKTSNKINQCSHPDKTTAKIIRLASQEDLKKFDWMRRKEEKAFNFCLDRIKNRNLPMKLVRVHYFFNEKKGIFYYTADGRVDFRVLVKDLAKELKMRIEMRQIGVRDEAKMIGGIGVCGRELCCGTFLKNFEPVTIQKAKKQRIAINPTKISGLCGRLMCCLDFEAESRGRLYKDKEEEVETD